MPVIPFYGAEEPELFAIERLAMDRPGRVIAALDRLLPSEGLVLDVGAGDGFTASRLAANVVALEPAAGMRKPQPDVMVIGGEAERLLGRYLGREVNDPPTTFEYRVALFVGTA